MRRRPPGRTLGKWSNSDVLGMFQQLGVIPPMELPE
jgi:hypothetical protein